MVDLKYVSFYLMLIQRPLTWIGLDREKNPRMRNYADLEIPNQPRMIQNDPEKS